MITQEQFVSAIETMRLQRYEDMTLYGGEDSDLWARQQYHFRYADRLRKILNKHR